jgi:germination protein M
MRNGRKWLPVLLIVLLLAAGCSRAKETNNPDNTYQPQGVQYTFLPPVIPAGANTEIRLMSVYVTDSTGTLVVPYALNVARNVSVGKETVTALIDSPEHAAPLQGTGLKLPLPAGSTVRGMVIRDVLAKIDFGGSFDTFPNAAAEKAGVTALVHTLSQFDNVSKVQIMVNGKNLPALKNGTDVSQVMTAASMPLNQEVSPALSSVDLEAKNYSPVTLYFVGTNATGTYGYFVPVTRLIPKVADEDLPNAALLELAMGPSAEQPTLHATVPVATRVLTVIVGSDHVAEVNLSKEVLAYGGGNTAEQAVLGSLLLTTTELSGVQGVRLLVEGQVPSLPEGTDVTKPIMRPQIVNPFIL